MQWRKVDGEVLHFLAGHNVGLSYVESACDMSTVFLNLALLQPRNGGSIIFTSTFVGYTAGSRALRLTPRAKLGTAATRSAAEGGR